MLYAWFYFDGFFCYVSFKSHAIVVLSSFSFSDVVKSLKALGYTFRYRVTEIFGGVVDIVVLSSQISIVAIYNISLNPCWLNYV